MKDPAIAFDVWAIFIAVVVLAAIVLFGASVVNQLFSSFEYTFVMPGVCSQEGFNTMMILNYLWQGLPIIGLLAICIAGIMYALLKRSGSPY